MSERKRVYRHAVLFKFFDATGAETVQGIEAAFKAFAKKLPFVIDFEWGTNSSPENLNDGFTHFFLVTFAGPEGRDAYLPHPEHTAFCGDYLDANLEKVCVVDYWANY